MLAEGRRRAERGERVVIGWIERHGRSETKTQLRDLEVIAPRQALYRGSVFSELDVAGVLASGAKVVLLDELAPSVPDTGRGRWEDAADLLGAGLDVVTTTNVANLESVRDYAARLTGVGVVESVPDHFVRGGEVSVVPMAVDALRQRIMAGKVYSADRVGGALAEYFQASNLEALNELCGAWVADNVHEVGSELLFRRGLASRPVVVAGVSGSQRGELVIKTAATIARQDDADLLVIHVDVTDSSTSRSRELERNRAMTDELGGRFTDVEGMAPVQVLANVARGRSRLRKPARFAVASRLRRLLPDKMVEEV
jgi:two-component system sensor histidine kinase KdpD